MSTDESKPASGVFKEELDPGPVGELCRRVAERVDGVDGEALAADACDGLRALELKARVAHVADAIRLHLAADGPTMLRQLVDILAVRPDEPELAGMLAWPVITVVERHGLRWPDTAFPVMRAITGAFSCEMAMRPFLVADLSRALAELAAWTDDEDEHVRRLVSESTRPRLPWAGHLRAVQGDPSLTIPLLDALRNDPSLYVRRSVANHLNDISKDHPDVVVEVLERWNVDAGPDTAWVTRHALRSLVKQGHRGALALQGFGAPSLVGVQLEVEPAELVLGGRLQLRATLSSDASQDLLVDVVVGFRKADGRIRPKTFKWTRIRLDAGESRTLTKSLHLKPISTRRYYEGLHSARLRINGVDLGPEAVWTLSLS